MRGSERSMIRAIRGPITLITVGALFAFNNFTPYRFEQTWPVILIVFGLLSLLGRSTERIVPPPPPGYPPAGYPPPAPGFPPPSGHNQGSYSQSPCAQPAAPASTPKGGFGASAPPPQHTPDPSAGNPGGSL
jgi:hypothetical protein